MSMSELENIAKIYTVIWTLLLNIISWCWLKLQQVLTRTVILFRYEHTVQYTKSNFQVYSRTDRVLILILKILFAIRFCRKPKNIDLKFCLCFVYVLLHLKRFFSFKVQQLLTTWTVLTTGLRCWLHGQY